MRIAIINSYYPPSSSATGYYANVLAKSLTESGASIDAYCTIGKYNDRMSTNDPVGALHQYGRLYSGRSRIRRLISAFCISFRLILMARIGGYDRYIVLSDPPFNNFWSALLLPSDRVVFWTMDLYPQAYIAAGLVSDRSWLYRSYQSILRWRRPGLFITLGDQQTKNIEDWIGDSEHISIPIGLQIPKEAVAQDQPSWADSNLITLGYVGNVGEAHDAEFIYTVASQMTSDQLMIYSGYGSKDHALRHRLSKLPNVRLLSGIPSSHMRHIDIQLITLLPQWTHICVPSKALSALQHGSALLYSGSPDSDTWQYIREATWLWDQDFDLKSIDRRTVSEKRKQNASIVATLEAKWATAIKDIKDTIL